MTFRRTSKSAVDFLGVELDNQLSRGTFANVFRVGDGTQRTIPAGVATLTTANAALASVNGQDYQAVVSVLESRGAESALARTLALVLLDTAKALNTNPLSLLDTVSSKAKIEKTQSYFIINQLRQLLSQTSKATPVSNQNSLVANQIVFSTPVPQQTDWASGVLEPIADPPTLVNQRTRRVQFDPKNQYLAVTNKAVPTHLDIYSVPSFQRITQVNLSTMVETVTGIDFNPTQALLAVGIYSPTATQGLRVFSTHNWQSQPNTPNFAFVNSVAFSPSGQKLAVVYAASVTSGTPSFPDQIELQVLDKNGWGTEFQISSGLFEPIDVAFSPTNNIMAVYGSEGTSGSAQVRFYSYSQNTWQLLNTRPTPGGTITYGSLGPNIAFDQTGEYVLVPGGELGTFDALAVRVDGFQAPININTSISRVYSVQPVPDQSLIVLVGAGSGSQTSVISFVETTTWTEVSSVSLAGVDLIPTVSLSSTGELLAAGDLTTPATGNPKIFTAAQVPI